MSSNSKEQKVITLLRGKCQLLESAASLDLLMEAIGDARIVLLGEASHGTHEYYTWRARITQRLVQEKGFQFIGVEGDWPDCYQINRYIKGYQSPLENIADVLAQFKRWPTWMWGSWSGRSDAQPLGSSGDRCGVSSGKRKVRQLCP